MPKYQVWVEGFAATGESGKAFQLISPEGVSEWEGETFKDACQTAMKALGWNFKSYSEERNSYWACRFFDNEADARESFG